MGFETSLFVVQPMDDNLTCALCLNVYDKPTTACANGHVYCLECLTRAKERSNACPDCRQPMIDSPPLNRPLQNLIGSLKLKCEHSQPKEGDGDQQAPPSSRRRTTESGEAVEGEAKEPEVCTWEGPVSEYYQHVKSCPFRVVKCPLKCRAKFQYRFLEHHKENECPRRVMICEKCGKDDIPLFQMDYHTTLLCPEADTQCNYCDLQMKRKELGSMSHFAQDAHTTKCYQYFSGHYKVCPKVPVFCEFAGVGCNHKGAREDMRDHHADNARYHAKLVSDAVIWQSANAQWSVASRLFSSTDYRVIDSPPIHVFGLPYQFFARLHLQEEKVEIELCIKETQQNGIKRPTLLLRAISISVEAYPNFPDEDTSLCFAKDLQSGKVKRLPPGQDSLGDSAFFYKREVNEVSTTNDGEENQRVRTTPVEVTRAMILGPEGEQEYDKYFYIKFDVKRGFENDITSR